MLAPGSIGGRLKGYVQRGQQPVKRHRTGAGVGGMLHIIQRRIPKSHDAVAHIFVNGALVVLNHIGHRRQKFVDVAHQPMRIKQL